MKLGGSNPYDPDSELTAALDAGHDCYFERGREKARDLLRAEDVIGFWFQAVGDGSALDADRSDMVTRRMAHQLAHVAGYADTLDYHEVTGLATTLFGHHVGVTTDPTSMGWSPEAILKDVADSLTDTAEKLFGGFPPDETQYPDTDGFAVQRERALALLEHDRLTNFWLQIIRDETHARLYLRYGPKDGTPDADWGFDTMADYPVEYILAKPGDLDVTTYRQLHLQYLTQHLFVAARTADRDLDGFCREAIDQALASGWIYETIGPV